MTGLCSRGIDVISQSPTICCAGRFPPMPIEPRMNGDSRRMLKGKPGPVL